MVFTHSARRPYAEALGDFNYSAPDQTIGNADKTSSCVIPTAPARFFKTVTLSPRGCQIVAFEFPQMVTHGTPSAAAKCVTPESWPTNAWQAPNRFANSGKAPLLIIVARLGGNSATIRCKARACDSSPTNTTRYEVFATIAIARFRHFASGQARGPVSGFG